MTAALGLALLAQVVAARTGVTPAEATRRVNDTIDRMKAAAKEAETKAREAADAARKVGVASSLWMFISLLAGAFCACAAAICGGKQRDRDERTAT